MQSRLDGATFGRWLEVCFGRTAAETAVMGSGKVMRAGGWRRTTSGYHPISAQAGAKYIGKSFGNVRIT